MVRRWWNHLGPWVVPTLLVVEVALVLSGRLALGTAVIVIVGVELLLALVAGTRIVAAVRVVRSSRASGIDGWAAAEDGLARLVPRPVARAILIEPRLLACLVRWLTGRHGASPATTFHYRRSMGLLIWACFVLALVEGAIVELVLTLVLPHSPWPWVSLGLHIYGLVWLAGFYASMVTRPHRLGEHGLWLRDSVFKEVVVPYAAITNARSQVYANTGRSGFKVTDHSALLAYGDATVSVTLDPSHCLQVNGESTSTPINVIRFTVDDSQAFVRALDQAQQRQRT